MAASPSSVARSMRKLSISTKDDSAPLPKSKSNKSPKGDDTPTRANKMRKRLSVVGAHGHSPLFLDGTQRDNNTASKEEEKTDDQNKNQSKCYKHYGMKTKVGMVPFNPNKVNQDRALIEESLVDGKTDAVFAVFDGHGMNGEDVSTYLTNIFPKLISKNKHFAISPEKGLTSTFAQATKLLKKSPVNCTFSGTTAVMTYLDTEKIYCANVGDSRAVLAREVNGQLKAIELSFDHKPDLADEKKRIEQHKGRVQPCLGPMGEHIGPARVWLQHQEMPGLAMSRSFGDDVATSIGVTSEPEIVIKDRNENDKFMILGSDGIWEFISNEEAVAIVAKQDSATKAARDLAKEATERWQREEDVIDDITVIVVFF